MSDRLGSERWLIGEEMAKNGLVALSLLLATVWIAGCGHKLVAHNGESTVSVYGSKEQFDKLRSIKSQGGAASMFGGIGESMLARRVDNNTPVKILSSDADGATVEVLDGAEKGLQGYVPKDNLD